MINKKYESIINMPRPTSKTHRTMSIKDRAAQFSAFAALTGYSDEISEKGRYTGERRFITEEQSNKINKRLNILLENGGSKHKVTITHFVKDAYKNGGREEKTTLNVRHVDTAERVVIGDKNEKILIDAIVNIEGEIF